MKKNRKSTFGLKSIKGLSKNELKALKGGESQNKLHLIMKDIHESC